MIDLGIIPDPVEWVLTVIIAAVMLWAMWVGGRKVAAEGRKVTAETSAVGQPAPPSWPQIWERLDGQDQQIEKLHKHRREDRSIIRDALSVLTGPVVSILDWLDSGAEPPPPHEHAVEVRRQIATLRARLTDPGDPD